MDNIIVIAIVALIVGPAVWYIRKEKRCGVQCVGCPDSKTCSGQCTRCSECCNGAANQPYSQICTYFFVYAQFKYNKVIL